MHKWLADLKSILKQGYLLTTAEEESNLNSIITLLEEKLSRRAISTETYYRNKHQRTQELLAIEHKDAVLNYIYSELNKIFTEMTSVIEHENDHKSITPIYHYLSPKTANALTHRISLVNSYKRLSTRYSHELHLDKPASSIKVTEKKANDVSALAQAPEPTTTHLEQKELPQPSSLPTIELEEKPAVKISAFEQIRKILESHPGHVNACEGLSLIKDRSIQLTSDINLFKALQLVWRAIPKDGDKAKKALYDNLALIKTEVGHLSTTSAQEKALQLILEPLEKINDPHVAILSTKDTITDLIKKKCDNKLKSHLREAPLAEKERILYHLRKKESIKEHLALKFYIEKTREELKKAFSAYTFIFINDGQSTEQIIEDSINQCIADISLADFEKTTQTPLCQELEKSKDPNVRKNDLIKLINVEIDALQAPATSPKERILITLRKRAEELIPSYKDITLQADTLEIDNLYRTYHHLLDINKLHDTLNNLIEEQNKPQNQLAYQKLTEQAKTILATYSYAALIKKEKKTKRLSIPGAHLLEPKIIEYGQTWFEYHRFLTHKTSALNKDVEKLMAQKKELDLKITTGTQKEVSLFNKQFRFPASYSNLGGREIVEKIQNLFQDYADKAGWCCWYYFHVGRKHVAEAREIADALPGKNPSEIKDYLISIKNALIAKDALNLQGSFSRRIHYCLDVILAGEPARDVTPKIKNN